MLREQRIHILFAALYSTDVLLINMQAHYKCTFIISACSGYEEVENEWRNRGEMYITIDKYLLNRYMKHFDTKREELTFCETLRVLKQGALLETFGNTNNSRRRAKHKPCGDKLS